MTCARRFSASLLVLLALGGTAAAEGICARGLPGVVAEFRRIKGLRARFVEEKHIALLARPLVTRGRLYYRAPDHLVRHTDAPARSSLSLHGDQLRMRDETGDKALDLGRWGPAQSLVASYLHVLGGDLGWLKAHYSVDFQCRAEAWKLRLVPTEADLARLIKSITLAGKGGDLGRVEVLDGNGDETDTAYLDADKTVAYTPADMERLYKDDAAP